MAATVPRAAIVSVGNELLFGETIDTNSAWLGRHLSSFGIGVARRFTVGDEPSAIVDALRGALECAGLVIVSGGLGPTPDDLTKPTVASALGRELVVDPDIEAVLKRRFAESGLSEVPPASRGQAEIPAGSIVLRNPEGTAPGILLHVDDSLVVLLPGVPRELQAIVQGDLQEHLAALSGGGSGRVWHHVVHTTGIAESRLTEELERALARVPPSAKAEVALAYLPDLLGVDLRFSAHGETHERAMWKIRPLLDAVESVVAPYRFEADSGDLADAVIGELRAQGRMLATAESCTGGLIAERLTRRPGSSDVFVGGYVAYANTVKVDQVGVEAADIERHGAVSQPVAEQLALGAARRLGADVGIGVTGIAGPGGGSEEKPVGTVWIGTSVDGRVEAYLSRFAGGRDAVRARAAQSALATVYRRLTQDARG